MLSERAISTFARVRPTPTTVWTRPAARSAKAKDPPMSPVPMTTTLSTRGKAMLVPPSGEIACSAGKRRPQRRQKPAILLRQTDRDAQMPGQAVIGHRPHDDALRQQALV